MNEQFVPNEVQRRFLMLLFNYVKIVRDGDVYMTKAPFPKTWDCSEVVELFDHDYVIEEWWGVSLMPRALAYLQAK